MKAEFAEFEIEGVVMMLNCTLYLKFKGFKGIEGKKGMP